MAEYVTKEALLERVNRLLESLDKQYAASVGGSQLEAGLLLSIANVGIVKDQILAMLPNEYDPHQPPDTPADNPIGNCGTLVQLKLFGGRRVAIDPMQVQAIEERRADVAVWVGHTMFNVIGTYDEVVGELQANT